MRKGCARGGSTSCGSTIKRLTGPSSVGARSGTRPCWSEAPTEQCGFPHFMRLAAGTDGAGYFLRLMQDAHIPAPRWGLDRTIRRDRWWTLQLRLFDRHNPRPQMRGDFAMGAISGLDRPALELTIAPLRKANRTRHRGAAPGMLPAGLRVPFPDLIAQRIQVDRKSLVRPGTYVG